MLLPSILTNEGLPHALRSIGALVPASLLVGFMLNKWAKNTTLKSIFIFLLVASAIINIYAYFILWGKSPEAYASFEFRLSGMGIYLRQEMPQQPKTNFYLVTNQDSFRTDADLPVMVEPIRFYTWQYRDRLKYILPDNFKINDIQRPAEIFFLNDNQSILDQINSKYPNARLIRVKVGSPNVNSEDVPMGGDFITYSPKNVECFMNPPIPVAYYFNFVDIR